MRKSIQQKVEQLPDHLRNHHLSSSLTLEDWIINELRIEYERGLRHSRENRKKKKAKGFDVFYENYPRRVARAGAERSWNKLHPNQILLEKILKDLERRKKGEWKDQEKRFIPYPATYLNQRRWEDEVEEEQTKSKLTW